MKKTTISPRLLLSLAVVLLVTLFISSCDSCNHHPGGPPPTVITDSVISDTGIHRIPFITNNVAAVVKDDWTGTETTETNDSVWYLSNGVTISGRTGRTGTVTITDNNYNVANGVIMHGTANGLICGKVFNRAYGTLTNDADLISPVFHIIALGGSADTVPVKIVVTDTFGVARSGYTVQLKQGGTNYGPSATTDANGVVANYGKGLSQGGSFTATATGSAGSSTVTVSTTPIAGSGGVSGTGTKLFVAMTIYIRY